MTHVSWQRLPHSSQGRIQRRLHRLPCGRLTQAFPKNPDPGIHQSLVQPFDRLGEPTEQHPRALGLEAAQRVLQVSRDSNPRRCRPDWKSGKTGHKYPKSLDE
jgi:hypothetical protein